MDTPFKRKAVPTHRIPLICKWRRAYTITRVVQTHVKNNWLNSCKQELFLLSEIRCQPFHGELTYFTNRKKTPAQKGKTNIKI